MVTIVVKLPPSDIGYMQMRIGIVYNQYWFFYSKGNSLTLSSVQTIINSYN